MWESVGAMKGLRSLRVLGKSPSRLAPLLGLRASITLWVSDSVMWGVAMRTSMRGWKVGVRGEQTSDAKSCEAFLTIDVRLDCI